ncbi:type 1 glutamine amidotransferase domain-containing protein [Aurantiacibacter sediminis]|uniref:Type 1 glutamine amidotransferase domain-containing protein n=1 Tax=Aurantiacibacter sediminis TaxID=2793064 RepID=A0ABS0N031_9SPHN|nr:type 1 glutamine amidotransferase domain-containing protein [Aurantiacibacter sediminis]MBH5321319.1 type 1 glutamine amidotransferase domain-containing protein [Aurantiacibacter sediminis]
MRTFFRISLVIVGVLTVTFAAWWISIDLDSQPLADPETSPGDLAFLANAVEEDRGTILAVVTSTERAGDGINAGYELTEMARAYYVFRANGYDVVVASPQGGRAPVNIDEELTEYDYAFLNEAEAQGLVEATLRVADVDPANYDAVYFVGGKGAMFDFSDNPDIQAIASQIYDTGGVVGAVCHGPAALIGVQLADGTTLLENKSVAGFSNEEELFIIPDSRDVFPYLLEDGLREAAQNYSEAPKYLDHTITDGRLVTGQNPWSTWTVAEGMIRALGHEPVEREISSEEKAIALLATYHAQGMDAALADRESQSGSDKRLILLHALIALMEGQPGVALQIQRLAH